MRGTGCKKCHLPGRRSTLRGCAKFLATADGDRPVPAADGHGLLAPRRVAQLFAAVGLLAPGPELRRPHVAVVRERGGRRRRRERRRHGAGLEQVVQQGEQREQQEDGQRYEADQAPVAGPGDAGLLEPVLPRAAADVAVGGRRVVPAPADEADLLVPVEATARVAADWAAGFTAGSPSGPRVRPTSAVGSPPAVAPVVGRDRPASVVGCCGSTNHGHVRGLGDGRCRECPQLP
mmetsp:Transcript_124256/g.351786  ORF Transcript_124256/g.351786 Transcript_124256/m.351786 type:complete len:234 (-) Transcript_124256:43-744(-)